MNRSKKAWIMVRVSASDASALALMLKLHREMCNDRARAHDMPDVASRSWSRAARKAQSFAVQFEMMSREAVGGQRASGTAQLR